MDLNTDISYLKGVGPQRAELLAKEINVYTFGDLLAYFPFRYVDRSHVSTISQLDVSAPYVVLKGLVSNMQTISTGRTTRLQAQFNDGTGIIELVWFQGIKWIKDSLKPNVEYLLLGKPSFFSNNIQIAHPDLEPLSYDEENQNHNYIPVYSTTEKMKAKGLGTRGIAKLTFALLSQLTGELAETIPQNIICKYHLMGRTQALRNIHFPSSSQSLEQAIFRMKFEELFIMQLDYQYARYSRQRHSYGRIFSIVGENFRRFYSEKLPFALTDAQKRVIKEIRSDMRTGRQMNRLLQGDVGSGKTMVAMMTMLIALDNGCQACLMAPTEILASQHFSNFQRNISDLGIRCELLIGSLKTSEKKKIKQRLAAGEIDFLIGTHALIEDDVIFKDLGYVVIDEQHRFGVEQRSKLWRKSKIPPHILVMTATPIPRTLAMTLYADLECSVIDQLPPGRQPIKTLHGTEANRLRVFSFLKQEIDKGRQVYIVYPLINESETLDLNDLMAGYESLSRSFPLPQYQISIVHGKMEPDAKAYEMDRFKRGETHIMVSTTVIEVGVDVPNASVMVIENAERFGLSQLHQLRGRVGRGSNQSYCILMTKDELSHNGQQRIQTMCATNDGFAIAEADLKLRGPGDLQGLQQSGILELRMADIVDDEPIVKATRDDIHDILMADPELQQPEHYMLNRHIALSKKTTQWSKIS